MKTQLCPNRSGHGIQIGCITCHGTGEFSLPDGAWKILARIIALQELRADERNVAAVLAVRQLCRLVRGDYEATQAGVTAHVEHNTAPEVRRIVQARGT